MKVKAFITHKLSEKYSDCQDYFVIDKVSRAIAVSDGMSQSIFPGWWAEELTKKFVECPEWGISAISESDLQGIQSNWLIRVKQFIEDSRMNGKDPWRLENCILERKGAGATLCGIRFDCQTWGGFALGDTCLFEIGEDNHVLKIYPDQEDGFGNHPDYFDSMCERKGTPQTMAGVLKTDVKLLIVSDPFAELIYKRMQENCEDKIIERMLQVSSHDEFENLVDEFRLNEKMHNDDSTMVCVEFDGDDNFNIETEDILAELIEKEKETEAENVVELNVVEEHEEMDEEAISETVSTYEDSANNLTEEDESKELQRLRQEREEIKNFLSEKEKQLNEQSKKTRASKLKKKNNNISYTKQQNILTDVFCFFRKLYKDL